MSQLVLQQMSQLIAYQRSPSFIFPFLFIFLFSDAGGSAVHQKSNSYALKTTVHHMTTIHHSHARVHAPRNDDRHSLTICSRSLCRLTGGGHHTPMDSHPPPQGTPSLPRPPIQLLL